MIRREDNQNYIKKILLENRSIFAYEVPIIIRALKKTFEYFCKNGIPFSVNDMFDFTIHHKPPTKLNINYRNEKDDIPAYDIAKFKINRNLKDYLNSRRKYTQSKHKEKLPDGEVRIRKIG